MPGNPRNIGMVDYAIGEVVAESTYTYENLLAAYPASNIRLLKAIAKAGCVREINSGDFITEYRLPGGQQREQRPQKADRPGNGLQNGGRLYRLRPLYGYMVAAATVLKQCRGIASH